MKLELIEPSLYFAVLPAVLPLLRADNQQYYYDQDAHYRPANGDYTVVEAPVGTTVPSLPPGAEAVVVNGMRGYYYYSGTYYQQTPTGLVVVAPSPGMIVDHLQSFFFDGWQPRVQGCGQPAAAGA